MQRRWLASIGLAGLLVASACSSSGDATSSSTTNDAKSAICSRFERLVEIGKDVRAPAVFTLSAEDLQASYDERRKLTEEIIELTDDEDLRAGLEDVNDRRKIVEPVLVENLSSNHDELEAIGYQWDIAIFNSDAADSDEKAAYHGIDAGSLGSRLQVLCVAPELAQQLEEDTDRVPEPGTIVYKRLDEGASGGLWAVPAGGGEGSALAPPAGWNDLSIPTVAPDGSTIVALATRDTQPHQGVAVGSLHEGVRVIYESTDEVGLECLRWDRPTGDVLASVFRFNEPSTVMRIDLSGATTPIETASANLNCADSLPDGRLVLSGSDRDIRKYGNVQIADRNGDEIVPLFGTDTCAEIVGSVDPAAGDKLLVFQTCDAPTERGLFVVDVKSGESSHPVVGPVATPSWSPKGGWITFGYAPLRSDSASTARIWLMRTDGTGLRQFTNEPSSYPVWVSDEL